MAGASKHKRAEIVDLTADSEDDAPPRKVARLPLAESRNLPNIHQHPIWLLDDDDEGGNEIVQSTQDGNIGFIQLGVIDAKIVGIQYYDGHASPGESVLIQREPSNQYDPNAIRVNNVQGNQIGHIPRKLAAMLSPYLDSRSLAIEGTLNGMPNNFDCPIRLFLFGTSEPTARAELEARMKLDKLPLVKEKREKKKVEINPSGRKKLGFQSSQPTFGASQPDQNIEESGPSLEYLLQSSERFRPRELDELVEQWGAPQAALAAMPMAEQPSTLQAQLLPYQRQGLAWMLQMENPKLPESGSKDIVQLWKCHERSNYFQNIATQFCTSSPPSLASGGILADDMGLGKTLQVISLIVEGGTGTTLIIAPVSVMSNWSQQIERHVKSTNALRVMTYHGSNRKSMTPDDFAKYDVVISTYGTLSTEYLPRNSKGPMPIGSHKTGLFSMKWRRVVLDEGHIIRNPATKAAIAASSLQAKSRWVLTGTPIVNTIKDLHSMLKFLAITGGLERLELFNAILTRPLTNGDPRADTLLQSIMRTMCLRRKKEMSFVDLRLPELSEYVHRIQFRNDELEKYKALQVEAKGLLNEYQHRRGQTDGKPNNVYRNLLEILLRLRQVCCHWKLCESRVKDLMALIESDKIVELTSENVVALQVLLQLSIDSSDECPICLETVHNPVITACKHVFGYECIERVIHEQHKCPMCRAALPDTDQLVRPAVEENKAEDADIDVDTKSSKTEALMSILKACRKDPKSKVVIFSQWTSFLNIIQHQLNEAGFKYARIDGTMTAPVRDAAMAALEQDPETRVLLASLAVCSVGLNLVAADTVILADSWWAPAIEDQAVDRVHRLGQTRPTTVWRLIMEESIEERVLEIQKEKRLLVGKAFQEKGKRGAAEKTTRMADIQKLLN